MLRKHARLICFRSNHETPCTIFEIPLIHSLKLLQPIYVIHIVVKWWTQGWCAFRCLVFTTFRYLCVPETNSPKVHCNIIHRGGIDPLRDRFVNLIPKCPRKCRGFVSTSNIGFSTTNMPFYTGSWLGTSMLYPSMVWYLPPSCGEAKNNMCAWRLRTIASNHKLTRSLASFSVNMWCSEISFQAFCAQ